MPVPINVRLRSAVGSKPREVRVVVKSERLLLQTYGQEFPMTDNPTCSGVEDATSTRILKRFNPVVLEDSFPAVTVGDGNCFYRAVSRALKGSIVYHVLLCVYTLLEIRCFPMFYDSEHSKFVDIIQDNRIVVATYMQLANDVCLEFCSSYSN